MWFRFFMYWFGVLTLNEAQLSRSHRAAVWLQAPTGSQYAQAPQAQGGGAQQFSAPPGAYPSPQQCAVPMGHHMHPYGMPHQGQQMFYPGQPGAQQMYANQPPHAGYAQGPLARPFLSASLLLRRLLLRAPDRGLRLEKGFQRDCRRWV